MEQITGPRRSQLALPLYLIACGGSKNTTTAGLCYLERQRAVECVPYFPPCVMVPAVTDLGNGNSSSTGICAVYWLAAVQLPSEPDLCWFSQPRNSHAGFCQQGGSWSGCAHNLCLSSAATPDTSCSPQPSTQVPSQCRLQRTIKGCFLMSLLTI